VKLSLEVADPATPPATTPDSEIKADLIAAIGSFKPRIKGKNSDVKKVAESP
jgi:hypothetical protein